MIFAAIGKNWKSWALTPFQVTLQSEYYKSVEMFDTHFRLKSDELFNLIIQLSRFFKDIGDFETSNTPDFRHPLLKGGNYMEQIGSFLMKACKESSSSSRCFAMRPRKFRF